MLFCNYRKLLLLLEWSHRETCVETLGLCLSLIFSHSDVVGVSCGEPAGTFSSLYFFFVRTNRSKFC
ncbi:hypothetical protein F8388_004745 [Cannabis sativa]|uniref:Uncharacterized protein n=1 Tax=Cannabis sativa TaxID=3483 RepID=A0A7J6HND4_CANSA|nr:hypothetical protein F8388_004745 [Cannabis sativa]